jgi:hypothetical protein
LPTPTTKGVQLLAQNKRPHFIQNVHVMVWEMATKNTFELEAKASLTKKVERAALKGLTALVL